MGTKFAAGKKAFGFCDLCAFRYKLTELKSLVRKGVDTNIKACPSCWNGDHPQNRLGEFPVHDPQALRNPRPDQGLDASRALRESGFNPVGFSGTAFGVPNNLLVLKLELGNVTVEIT